MHRQRILAIALLAVSVAAGGWYAFRATEAADIPDYKDHDTDAASAAHLVVAIDKLRPLHKTMGKPAPGDWLAQHTERGQTFDQYTRTRPVRPLGKRNTIYIQPLGEFTQTQRKIIDITAELLGCYYNCPVKINADIPLDKIPDKARRIHPTWGDKQILSTYVLRNVLKPNLPEDAAAAIAFTASDLWPGGGWNFVFGQASLNDRVGVWSIYRNGDPDKSDEAYMLCLRRTLKVATHETGHMFSIHHCIAYDCNMNGSNNLPEADRQPLWLCPQCMAKVNWAARIDPAKRFANLKTFCEEHELEEEAMFFGKAMEKLNKLE